MELSSVIHSDCQDIEASSGECLGLCVISFSQLISGTIFAFVIGWKFALVCLAAYPIVMGGMILVVFCTTSKLSNKHYEKAAASSE